MSTSDGRCRSDAMIPGSLRRCCFRPPQAASERSARGDDHGGRVQETRAGWTRKRRRLTRLPTSSPFRLAAPTSPFGEGIQDEIPKHSPQATSRHLGRDRRAAGPDAGGRRFGCEHVQAGPGARRLRRGDLQRRARADTGAGVRGVPRRGLCGDDGFARRHRDDVTAFAGNPPLRVPHPSLDADDSDRRLTIVTGVRECPVTPLRRSDGDWVEGGEAMRNLHGRVVITAAVLVAAAVTLAAQTPAKTFVAVLSPEAEVPACAAASNAAGGSFVAHVVDEATGAVEWKLVANNLPGTIVAAHIHLAPKGVAGPIVQPLPPTPGDEHGVIGTGTFTNPALVAGLRANPDGYYVNVHTTVCPAGAARGQLGDHGPGNN